jgi:hypothetical protein
VGSRNGIDMCVCGWKKRRDENGREKKRPRQQRGTQALLKSAPRFGVTGCESQDAGRSLGVSGRQAHSHREPIWSIELANNHAHDRMGCATGLTANDIRPASPWSREVVPSSRKRSPSALSRASSDSPTTFLGRLHRSFPFCLPAAGCVRGR